MASLRSCGTKPCSQHLVKRSWRQTVTFSPPYWYTSAGIPSIPGDFPGFIWRTAFFISSSVGRTSSSVFTSALGILGNEDSSTLRLSLKRLLKCSDQRCMMASLSVRRVEPSAERRGAWICCEGPCTALRASKNERVPPRSGRRKDMSRSEYPIGKLYSLLAIWVFIMKPTPERRRSSFVFPYQ